MTEFDVDRAIEQGRLHYRIEAEPGSDCERMRTELAETLRVVREERDQLRHTVIVQADTIEAAAAHLVEVDAQLTQAEEHARTQQATIDDLVGQMERMARGKPTWPRRSGPDLEPSPPNFP